MQPALRLCSGQTGGGRATFLSGWIGRRRWIEAWADFFTAEVAEDAEVGAMRA